MNLFLFRGGFLCCLQGVKIQQRTYLILTSECFRAASVLWRTGRKSLWCAPLWSALMRTWGPGSSMQAYVARVAGWWATSNTQVGWEAEEGMVLPGRFCLYPRLSCFKALAHKTLVLLLGVDPSRQLDHPLPTVHPQVTYAYMKNMWKSARKVCIWTHPTIDCFSRMPTQSASHCLLSAWKEVASKPPCQGICSC